jgi:polyhydroxyalkanoate synthesis regulator protein
METIVKYKNRKMYSKKLSKYVNLDYIIDLVRSNSNLEILDYSTNKNITNLVLSEAIIKLNLNTSELLTIIKKGGKNE